VAEDRVRLQVAFSRIGDVFVADGYCNARVMQYAADGTFVREFKLAEVRGAISVALLAQ